MYQNTEKKETIVKIVDPDRQRILQIIDSLERDWIIGEVSRFRKNREGDGFHVFVPILEARR